ncbi:hypothetical protein M5K25_021647 [Dendrobium thyrsiflorum]|uniref:Uncharacterized protein n=1 Tax=Dendrobium thyrsiflorum TaxID=117978 RepID=A0ABD0UCY9_DENTH
MKGVGDVAYKAFTAGLGAATIYLAFTFSINVYRGLSWHTSQSVRFSFRILFFVSLFELVSTAFLAVLASFFSVQSSSLIAKAAISYMSIT